MAQISGDWINPGRMNLRVNADGELASFNNNAASEVISGSNNHFFKFINLWISGLDVNNNLHISTVNSFAHKSDFSPGPIDSLEYIGMDPKDWNYVWSVQRSQIQYHRNNFKTTNYKPVDAIKNWPANKTGRFYPYLAPFIDYDGNGMYEPEKGDYPDFPGQMAAYFIVNDNYGEHKASSGQALSIELYGMLYSSGGLSNTVYGKYYIVNRTDKNYHDIALSIHSGVELGNSQDNYLGTHVNKNCIFSYNGDMDDDAHFGNKMPVSALFFLNHKLSSSLYITNDGHSETGMPNAPAEHRNLMEGKWKTGKSLSYGSDGLNTGENASFVYPFNTDPAHTNMPWVEQNKPGERSILGNLHIDHLNAKAYIELDFALCGFESSQGDPYSFVGSFSEKLMEDWQNQSLSIQQPTPLKLSEIKNPTQQGECIDLKALQNYKKIDVINHLGQVLLTLDPKVENTLIISQPGIYYLILSSDNQHFTKKIIII